MDRDRYRLWQSGQLARIRGSSQRAPWSDALGSDPRRAHGLAPSLILADEPAQWPESTGERMVAALMTALGKIPDARLIALGTRPAGNDHWFAKALAGGADYAQTHAAAPADPPFQRRTWAKANPSLNFMPDLEATIRREARHAKTDPALFPGFRALRLNGGTSDTEESMLIDAGTWETIEGERDRAGPVIWGCDLGTSAAMSAIAAFWPETGRLESVAAFPHDPPLSERGLRDGVGGLYQQCSERGELIQTGQRAVALPGLLREALDRFGRPARIVADRWREAELRDALDAAGIPPAALEIRGPRIQRRRGRRSRVPARRARRESDPGQDTLTPLRRRRGACHHGSVRQLETGQIVRGRPTGAGPRRCRRRCHFGRRCRNAPGRQATGPPPPPRACRRMSRNHLPLLRTRRWQHVRRAAFNRDAYRCQECHRPGRLEAHHEPPLAAGGDPYALSGIVTLCRGCHIEHHRPAADRAGRAAWRALVAELL